MCVVQCKPSHLAEVVTSLHLLHDYSRYCKSYFLRKKSEALDEFKEFKVAVEKETGMNIKALRADRGGKQLSEEFKKFFERMWHLVQSQQLLTPHNRMEFLKD